MKVSKSKYRQRGYECEACGSETIVYGQDPVIGSCLHCGSVKFKKLWDNTITQTTEVQPNDEAPK